MGLKLIFIRKEDGLGCDWCDHANEVEIDEREYYVISIDFDESNGTIDIPEMCRDCIARRVGEYEVYC